MNIGAIKDTVSNIGRTLSEPIRNNPNLRTAVETLSPAFPLGGVATTAGESLSDVFASRTGLSTNLNALTVRAAAPQEVDDRQFDGHLVGAGGQTFAPGTALGDVPAVTPAGGVRNNETLIYINGIRNDVGDQSAAMQALADTTGSRVIGVHNATGGMAADLIQSYGDKLDIGQNLAVDSLADTVYDELMAGRDVHLMAHSQGALVTSRALTDVRNRLMAENGMTEAAAETMMNSIRVETFGGAARRFPDGPQYVHYVNRNDGVPQAFGLRSWLNPFAEPGEGAVTHYFREGRAVVSHGFEEFYLPERVPFEQARRGEFN